MTANLTGAWQGVFSFPRDYDPVPFMAKLRHDREWLTGSTEELIVRGEAAGSPITATLTGRVSGSEVSFMKTYDHPPAGYDAVSYAGTVDARGDEISGTWTIPGGWSGTFLMIRASRAEQALGRRESQRA